MWSVNYLSKTCTGVSLKSFKLSLMCWATSLELGFVCYWQTSLGGRGRGYPRWHYHPFIFMGFLACKVDQPTKHSFLLQMQNVVVVEARTHEKGILMVQSAASLSFTIASQNPNAYKPLINQTEAGAQQPTTTTSTGSGAIAVIMFISSRFNILLRICLRPWKSTWYEKRTMFHSCLSFCLYGKRDTSRPHPFPPLAKLVGDPLCPTPPQGR